jgi:ribosome-associated heat shock protein Hsp15
MTAERRQRTSARPVPEHGQVRRLSRFDRSGVVPAHHHTRAPHYSGGMTGEQVSARVDSWIWSVRLAKTRSVASDACRGGHVRVNGVRVKPAHAIRVGDEVRLRHEGCERIVVVCRIITKRVGAPVAAECYIDKSPPPPPRDQVVAVAVRDRGTGRPTKRERRSIEKLFGRPTAERGDHRADLD